jgi:phosphoglycolate phosphatase
MVCPFGLTSYARINEMTLAISRIRAIAIDLDGTLLDTIPDLCGAVNRTLTELGLSELPLHLVKSFVGKGLGEHMRKSLLAALNREPTADEKAHAMMLYKKHYSAHIADQTTIYPGVVDGLDLFRASGLKMSVVTNKWTSYSETLLAHFKLAPYFDHLVCGDTLTTGKPDPGMMFYSAGRFGVHPREMLMIGDSGNDSRAAQAAGSPVVLMTYGYSEGENLVDLHANAIVGTFTDIHALFNA